MNRFLNEEDDLETGLTWVASYYLGTEELDDSFDDEEVVEVNLEAETFEDAVRYAEQYLRKQQVEESTAEKWAKAQLISVQLF